MKFFEIIKGSFKPQTFFSTLPDENIGQPLLYYLIWSSIFAAITIPIAIIGSLLFSSVISSIFGFGEIGAGIFILLSLAVIAAYFIVVTIALFAVSGIYHLILKMTGAKKTFAKTFQIIVYSYTPNALYGIISIPLVVISLIPFVGIIFSMLSFPLSLAVMGYGIFLRVYGFAKGHKLSYLKAAIPDIVALIVGAILTVAYFVFIIVMVSQSY